MGSPPISAPIKKTALHLKCLAPGCRCGGVKKGRTSGGPGAWRPQGRRLPRIVKLKTWKTPTPVGGVGGGLLASTYYTHQQRPSGLVPIPQWPGTNWGGGVPRPLRGLVPIDEVGHHLNLAHLAYKVAALNSLPSPPSSLNLAHLACKVATSICPSLGWPEGPKVRRPLNRPRRGHLLEERVDDNEP